MATPILLTFFQKIKNSALPNTKARKRHHKKSTDQLSLMNANVKILNKMLVNQIQQYFLKDTQQPSGIYFQNARAVQQMKAYPCTIPH
jgi:hypothetical protein